MDNLRSSEKHSQASQAHEVLGVNFHDFIAREEYTTTYELASEFGISLGDVRKLKKQLYRS